MIAIALVIVVILALAYFLALIWSLCVKASRNVPTRGE